MLLGWLIMSKWVVLLIQICSFFRPTGRVTSLAWSRLKQGDVQNKVRYLCIVHLLYERFLHSDHHQQRLHQYRKN